jgi:hypothetical protein
MLLESPSLHIETLNNLLYYRYYILSTETNNKTI